MVGCCHKGDGCTSYNKSNLGQTCVQFPPITPYYMDLLNHWSYFTNFSPTTD